MKKIFIFILSFSTLIVNGQNHLWGVRSGFSSTNISSSNFLSNYESRQGINAGLTYEFLFKNQFSIGADLTYNQRGFIDLFEFVDNPVGEIYKSTLNYDYVSLPIKTGFNIGSKIFGFVNIGAIPSLLVDAKTTSPEVNSGGKVIGYEIFDATSRVTKFDLAGLAEIGGGFKLKNRLWLFTSFAYQYSFTEITNSNYFASSHIRHNGMTLTIGLKCSLKKSNWSKKQAQ